MRINARLDEEHAHRLEEIRARTGESTTEIVKRGIDACWEQVQEEPASLLEALQQSGFIDSGSGPEDLSANYKQYLYEGLLAKHGHR